MPRLNIYVPEALKGRMDVTRTTISVPRILRGRMDKVNRQFHPNWSFIACTAFEAFIDELDEREAIDELANLGCA